MNTPNAYRVAYESALAEITEITAKFEALRTRKSHVEHLVAALQAYLAPASSAERLMTAPAEQAGATMETTPDPMTEVSGDGSAEAEPSYSYLDVPNPLPEGDGDPFQRRVKATFRFKGLATQRSF